MQQIDFDIKFAEIQRKITLKKRERRAEQDTFYTNYYNVVGEIKDKYAQDRIRTTEKIHALKSQIHQLNLQHKQADIMPLIERKAMLDAMREKMKLDFDKAILAQYNLKKQTLADIEAKYDADITALMDERVQTRRDYNAYLTARKAETETAEKVESLPSNGCQQELTALW